MDELYEYLRRKRDGMYAEGASAVVIDTAHLFRIMQTVNFFRQIRNIVNYDEDLEKMMEGIKRD